MKTYSPINCEQEEEETVNNIPNRRACGLSGLVLNNLTHSCRHHECPNNGTKCKDSPDEPGIIQLPCLREEPSLGLCSTCCMLEYLEGICAFYRERL